VFQESLKKFHGYFNTISMKIEGDFMGDFSEF